MIRPDRNPQGASNVSGDEEILISGILKKTKPVEVVEVDRSTLDESKDSEIDFKTPMSQSRPVDDKTVEMSESFDEIGKLELSDDEEEQTQQVGKNVEVNKSRENVEANKSRENVETTEKQTRKKKNDVNQPR